MNVVKLQLFKDKAGEWRWNAIAGNGEVVSDSAEGYKNKEDCIDQALEIFPDVEVEEIND